MKKIYFGLCLGIISIVNTNTAFTQTTFSFDEQTMVKNIKDTMKNSPQYQEVLQSSMQLLDINNDHYISDRETSKFIEGLNYNKLLTDEQKQTNQKTIMEFFKKADTSNDNKLSEQEFLNFWNDIQEWMIKERFRQMDRNKDGIYNEQDIPSMEESLAKLDEMKHRLEETTEQLKNIDPQEFVDNLIENIKVEQTAENIYQMDKNADNCISKEEFADYNVQMMKNYENTEPLISHTDFLEIYDTISKKDPNCLTAEEYESYINEPIDLSDTDISE